MGAFRKSGRGTERKPRGHMRGAAAVEFALVAFFAFLPLLITITDLGRWYLAMNAVSEATRFGARLAVVCSPDDWSRVVLPRMRALVPGLEARHVEYERFPSSSCKAVAENPGDVPCTGVSVTVSNFRLEALSPWLSGMPVFPFKVSLPSENMTSSWEDDGTTINNPVCN